MIDRKDLVLAVATVLVIGAATSTELARDDTRPVVLRDTAESLPSDTAADWVTYGDHLVQARVSSTRALSGSPPDDDSLRTALRTDRRVMFTIGRILWSRHNAPRAPRRFDVTIDGWTTAAGHRRQVLPAGQPLVRRGRTYLLLIARLGPGSPATGSGWAPIAPDTILPFEGSLIGVGDIVPGYRGRSGGDTDLRDLVWGRPVSELIGRLETATPDPRAIPHMAELPSVRHALAVSG